MLSMRQFEPQRGFMVIGLGKGRYRIGFGKDGINQSDLDLLSLHYYLAYERKHPVVALLSSTAHVQSKFLAELVALVDQEEKEGYAI